MAAWKDHVSFLLVEPQEPGNVGAAARAMKNMGFRRMGLINPVTLTGEARWMACNAAHILQEAVIHSCFEEAARDHCLVVGTTRRLGRKRGLVLPMEDGIRRIIRIAGKGRVALVFGREDKGLNNSETDGCDFLLTIPADPSSPSLNLAQAVLLIAYELSRGTCRGRATEFASRRDLEELYEKIRETLRHMEYAPRGNRDLEERIVRNIRRIMGRAGITASEASMIQGLCAQIRKRLGPE